MIKKIVLKKSKRGICLAEYSWGNEFKMDKLNELEGFLVYEDKNDYTIINKINEIQNVFHHARRGLENECFDSNKEILTLVLKSQKELLYRLELECNTILNDIKDLAIDSKLFNKGLKKKEIGK